MEIFTHTLGEATEKGSSVIIWAHGWGQDHRAFLPLAESLRQMGYHVLIDLPGFGQSPQPDEDWDTADYADAIAEWLKAQNFGTVIWAGHSFGCRVGIRLAARYPELIQGLAIIAGAGLPKKWKPGAKLYFQFRVSLFKALKKLIPLGLNEDWLRSRFGSADYKNAGSMRTILVKTVREDLTEIARDVSCPTILIYGQNDTETPAEYGERYQSLIPSSEFFVLDEQDHYTVLSTGRHQVAPLLQKFIKHIA